MTSSPPKDAGTGGATPPIVIVNMEGVDFVEQPQAVTELIRQIGSARYRGTRYYRANHPDLFDQ